MSPALSRAVFVVLGLGLFGTAMGAAPKSTKAPAAMPTKRPPDREVGRTLWLQSCWQCHGETGKGDGPAAVAVVGGVPSLESLNAGAAGSPDGAPPAWSEEQMTRLVGIVQDGKGRMPAYKEDIDKHDSRRILGYLRDALQGRTQAGGEDGVPEEDDNNKN